MKLRHKLIIILSLFTGSFVCLAQANQCVDPSETFYITPSNDDSVVRQWVWRINGWNTHISPQKSPLYIGEPSLIEVKMETTDDISTVTCTYQDDKLHSKFYMTPIEKNDAGVKHIPANTEGWSRQVKNNETTIVWTCNSQDLYECTW